MSICDSIGAKRVLFTCLVAIFAASDVAAISSNVTAAKNHGQWISQVNHLGELRFSRAYTGESGLAFMVDSYAGSCDSYRVMLVLVTDEVYPEDRAFKIGLKLRVDRFDVHEAEGSVSQAAGEETMYIEFEQQSAFTGIYEEIMKGSRLRYELDLLEGKEKIHGGFSLSGSKAALMRADELCWKLKPTKTDKDYFSNESKRSRPQTRSDQDYF